MHLNKYLIPQTCVFHWLSCFYWVQGLHLTEKTVATGGKTDGQFENPRASNANKGDRPLSIPVVTAALGFVTNFEDVYRLWAFVAKFLDVNFVSERGELATAVPLTFNQETVVL